jgi:hypothetical protein
MKIKIIKISYSSKISEEFQTALIGLIFNHEIQRGKFYVSKHDVVTSLKNEGKTDAADFWKKYEAEDTSCEDDNISFTDFFFNISDCEIVNNDGSEISFSKKFFFRWYLIRDEIQQVVIFPRFYNSNHSKEYIERIPGKKRRCKSIDLFVQNLESGKPCAVSFSVKQLKKVGYIFNKVYDENAYSKLIKFWSELFEDLGIMVSHSFEYHPEKKKHQAGKVPEKKLRKISGIIQRL